MGTRCLLFLCPLIKGSFSLEDPVDIRRSDFVPTFRFALYVLIPSMAQVQHFQASIEARACRCPEFWLDWYVIKFASMHAANPFWQSTCALSAWSVPGVTKLLIQTACADYLQLLIRDFVVSKHSH